MWYENQSLDGKTALVCGASQGIGSAIARGMAERGARIVALSRRKEALEELISTLKPNDHRILAQDLSELTSLSDNLNELLKELESIEILVINSGGPKGGAVSEAESEEFTQAMNSHLLAGQILVQKLLPGMRKKNYGRILAIISTSVKAPIDGLGVSNTVRGAVANWAKTLARELAPDQITVNGVLPGFTRTPRLHSLVNNKAAKTGKSPREVEEDLIKTVPTGRFAEPEEVAELAIFLASPAASYINGTFTPVDGGRTQSI